MGSKRMDMSDVAGMAKSRDGKQEAAQTQEEKKAGGQDALGALAKALKDSGIKGALEDIDQLLQDCSSSAAAFETSMAGLKIMADTSVVPVDTMKNEILSLSSELGIGAGKVAESVSAAIRAGVDTASSVGFVETASKLAAGGFTDTATSVKVLAAAMNGYKLEANEVEQVSDYLITTQRLGKTTVGELASAMEKVIPVAAASHVEMDNLSAAYAVLTKDSHTAGEAGAYLKAILGELGDSSSLVAGILRSETGMSFEELSESGSSLGDIMALLGESVGGNTEVFRKLWESSEAGVGALSLLETGSEEYASVLVQMRQSAGAAEEAFALMADTTQGAHDRMDVAVENMKTALGDALNPALEKLYETGADAFGWAADFVSEHPEVVQAIMAITTVAGALTAGLTVLHGALTMIEVVQKMIASHPTAMIVTAVVAAVAALGTYVATLELTGEGEGSLRQRTNELRDSVEELNEAIKGNQEAYEQKQEAMREQAEATQAMIEQLETLMEAEGNSQANRESIKSLVEELNEMVPELALAYDEETDSLNKTAEAIRTTVEAQAELSEYDAAIERRSELLAENRAKSEELAAVQGLLAESEAYLEEVQRQYNNNTYEGAYIIAEAQAQTENLRVTMEATKQALRDNVEEYYAVGVQINEYTAANADLLPSSRAVVDSMLEQAEALQEDEKAYQQMVEQIAEAALAHEEFAEGYRCNIESIEEGLHSLWESYYESAAAAYDSISSQVGLFENMKIESKQSIEGLIGNLQSQTEYMNTYAENIDKAMELGVDRAILERLSDGSKESAGYLAAIAASGKEEVDQLNAEFAKVEVGKNKFSDAVGRMATDFDKEMEKMETSYDKMVTEMDQFDKAFAASLNTCKGVEEAIQSEQEDIVSKNRELKEAMVAELDDYGAAHVAAEHTCEGVKSGVDAMWDSVVEKHRALARAAWEAYNQEIDIHSPSRKFKWSAEMTMEGLEAGVQEGSPAVMKAYRETAREAWAAYEEGSRSLTGQTWQGQAMMMAFTSGLPDPATAEASIRDYDRRLLVRMMGVGQDREERGVREINQTVNIYRPVESPAELAREMRKAGREMWLDG
ncbi:MAG: phage tail tape measure protein [Lachnospiraceae bacterium]|jgi:TP901 family phage tail tape measure protein|nr:phage tail tape measure protein [Lachnospiraceae bacterium]